MRVYTDRFHVGAGTTVGPLTVFPVWSEVAPVAGFVTPTASGMVVSEQTEPNVERLIVRNPQRTGLLIPEGTLLDGGLQTRVVAADTFVAAGTARNINVRCVEQGRWHSAGAGDAATRHEVDGRAPVSVVAALRGIGGVHDDSQGKVWERVEKLQEHYGSRSTKSLLDMMAVQGLNQREGRRPQGSAEDERAQQSRVDPRLRARVQQLASRSLPGQSGVLIGIGGEPIALELHGNPDSLSSQIQQIINAAILDAVTVRWEPTPGVKARNFAEEIMFTPVETTRMSSNSQSFTGVGEGVDIRSIATSRRAAATMHTTVINPRHKVALAI